MKGMNRVGLAMIAASFVVLIPGLLLDLVTINASIVFMGQQVEVFDDTRSIVGTIDGLYESGNPLVATLILLFSVIVPFIKGSLLLVCLAMRPGAMRWRLFAFVRGISKWAMADVFVVGVYVAFLSAKATDNLDAEVHAGLYFFIAYCLISIASLQFIDIRRPVEIDRA